MTNETKNELITIEKPDVVVLQGDPQKQMMFAKQSADIVCQYIKPLIISKKKYWAFEHWQTAARFYGATVGVEWTKPVMREVADGKTGIVGYEARANVYMGGNILSSAEAMCMRKEKNWGDRDEFALRSMAQTRASAKALRNVFAWVAVLAGVKPTPADEMDSVPHDVEQVPPEQNAEAFTTGNTAAGNPPTCSVCDEVVSDKVAKYSKDKLGKVLCFNHQKNGN